MLNKFRLLSSALLATAAIAYAGSASAAPYFGGETGYTQATDTSTNGGPAKISSSGAVVNLFGGERFALEDSRLLYAGFRGNVGWSFGSGHDSVEDCSVAVCGAHYTHNDLLTGGFTASVMAELGAKVAGLYFHVNAGPTFEQASLRTNYLADGATTYSFTRHFDKQGIGLGGGVDGEIWSCNVGLSYLHVSASGGSDKWIEPGFGSGEDHEKSNRDTFMFRVSKSI